MAISLSNAFVTLFDTEVKQGYQGESTEPHGDIQPDSGGKKGCGAAAREEEAPGANGTRGKGKDGVPA